LRRGAYLKHKTLKKEPAPKKERALF
jgi:hypothetical protein